ncbi:DUF2202 domain-containing protein [Prodigiosinella aquatilis]|nr:DUF2202 domain-containing protein [Prodigiosinella sp. LS101]WJV54010.1 DUF2202 domain-containing protein [Prodigiosinella sp. LS101]WJV58371.1 DUF2202 domain-containing protein [Pectobacteriaceae bacterium C111]
MMKRVCCIGMLLFAAALPVGTLQARPVLDKPAQDALLSALHDEYHAEAFYAAVIDKFGQVMPFRNIIKAERNHERMLKNLMQTYDLPIPPNTLLGDASLKNTVPATLREACQMGVDVESANRELYDKSLIPAVASHQNIVAVFQKLRDASHNNHLPAFERCR